MKKVVVLFWAMTAMVFASGLECKVEDGKLKAVLELDRLDQDRKITFLWTSPQGVNDNRTYENILPAGHSRIWDWRNATWRKGNHEVQILIDGEPTEYSCKVEVQ